MQIPTLEGTHVRLEPLTLAHLPALEAIAFDPSIWRYMLSILRTPEDLRVWAESALATPNTLTITPVGRASIHFDAHLEFYNGHTCDLSGGALYRKNGSFVYDDKPSTSNSTDPVCHLGIKPTATGVTFEDYTGGCKMTSCGERGGWNGASFTFAERVPTKPPVK